MPFLTATNSNTVQLFYTFCAFNLGKCNTEALQSKSMKYMKDMIVSSISCGNAEVQEL